MTGLTLGDGYRVAVQPVTATGALTGSSVTSAPVTVGRDAQPEALRSVSVVANDDQTITIAWELSSSGQAPDTVTLSVYEVTGTLVGTLTGYDAYIGTRTIPAPLASVEVVGYEVNTSGKSAATVSNTATVASSCPTGGFCVRVSARQPESSKTLPGQGFLHGMADGAGNGPDYTELANLHPQSFRESIPADESNVAAYNALAGGDPASETIMLSDLWSAHTSAGHGGYAQLPWSNWTEFSTFITETVTATERQGLHPWWQMFNEPDGTGCSNVHCRYFSPTDRKSVTTARLLQMFLVEYRAIKAADSAAKVMGPSTEVYADVPAADHRLLDVEEFVQFAASHHMRIDALSWHEESDGLVSGDWYVSGGPWNFSDHVQRAKALLAQYPAVGDPVLIVDEYNMPQTHLVPSWDLWWFEVMDDSPVVQAQRACWGYTECFTPDLDGLLTQLPSGEWAGTTPAYWTARDYAQLQSQSRLPVSSSASWRMSGIASRQDSTRTVTVVLGHHVSCDASANAGWCPSGESNEPAALTTVTIDWPFATTSARVTVDWIPGGLSPISGPTVVSVRTLRVVGGEVTVPIQSFGDGDVYRVSAVGV